MFINDIHIFWYVGFGLIGIVIGRFMELLNKNLVEHKKFFSVPVLKEYLKKSNINYKMISIVSLLYIVLLFFVGMQNKLQLIQYIILVPLLISVFCIDYKYQIIPTRLTLTMWEIGIVFSFIRGMYNLNVAIEMWVGMLLGIVIFLILTFLGNCIFKKETMGFGDVKIMGALGLIFGWRSVIAISIISFLIAALFSIILIVIKKVKKQEINEFIPFGPFIVLATGVIMFIPLHTLIKWMFTIFSFASF